MRVGVMALLAHVGQPPAPHDLAGAWTLSAPVLVALAAAGWLYARGVDALWRSAGRGEVVSRRAAMAFIAGLFVVAMALLSPLDALSSALFSAHMIQHLLLVLVAPPLIAAGHPGQVIARVLPPGARRRAGRWQGRVTRVGRAMPALPVIGLLLFAVVLWGWHVPAAYELSVRNQLVHDIEHVSLLGSALLLWWPIVRPRTRPVWSALLVLFVAAFSSGVLAVLLTFSPEAWYDVHAPYSLQWGLTALEDQQLAGVIMWVPGGVLYLIAAAVLFLRWFDDDERAAQHAVSQLPAALRKRSTPEGSVHAP